MPEEWDCVVVGGGAAGLSAALVLGRARRRTVVIDAEEQSNRASPVIGGFLGYDRRPPAELYAAGRRELSWYPSVDYRRGQVRRGHRCDSGFVLEVDDGGSIRARRVLLATGMLYCPPQIPGLPELWGTSVFQCPFCHGWEMRDKRLAVLAAGEEAVHAALLLRGWSDDVVALTDGRSDLSHADVDALRSADVIVDDRRIVELIGHDGELTDVAFADGTRLARDGLLVETPLRQRAPLAEQLGAACAPGALAVDAIGIDDIHRTSAGGVFAAGDTCAQQPHLAGAVAAGSQAAMIIVQSLLADEFGLPYPPT
ncbi:NAD(P)/FAD-dependent oxidoreductase [Mycobacterium sp. URHB0021]|jgi:thioredoxin reductase